MALWLGKIGSTTATSVDDILEALDERAGFVANRSAMLAASSFVSDDAAAGSEWDLDGDIHAIRHENRYETPGRGPPSARKILSYFLVGTHRRVVSPTENSRMKYRSERAFCNSGRQEE